MATNGTFKKSGTEYTVEIFTLSLQANGVRLVPDQRASGENALSHRVLVGRPEIGAARTKKSTKGREHLGLKLDNPSFAAPICANLFDDQDGEGLSLAAQSSWLMDGPSRRVVLGKRVDDLRHTSPKHLIAPGSPAGAIVQALRQVGLSRAADVLRVAALSLTDSDKKALAQSAAQAPAWMCATLLSIADRGTGDHRG